ncbi:N-acetylglucosamine-6-phosphate deacetylase [bacterium]|nr:N-acetylglucosamine-6-phosphate deacetylase [Clostridia bacterium]MBR4490387.1 N-acetylglucosamine-6-phosphate deacetylase [bacterium]
MKKLLKNGYIFDTSSLSFRKMNMIINDALIESLNTVDIPDCCEIIDCTEKYLVPGLIDVHTHGRAGYDFISAASDQIDLMRRSYALCGTTTLMATLASAPLDGLLSSSDRINGKRNPEPGKATIAGIHLEGRYLNPEKKGAHAPELLSPPDDGQIITLLERMCPLPIHVSAAPELDPDGKFIETVTSFGATYGIAHTNATYEEADDAVKRGARSFTHTFNCMRAIHHREPGCAVSSLLSDDAYSEFICDGEHVRPEMIVMASRLKPRDRFVLVTDSMEAAGCSDGEYSIGGLPVTVKNGKATTHDGVLAGSTLDLFTALSNYMKFTGLPLEEALPAATSNPADMVNIAKVCGRLLPGLRADLLILDSKDEPKIIDIYAAGEKVLRER